MRIPRHSFRKNQKSQPSSWSSLLKEETQKKKKRNWPIVLLLTLATHSLLIFFLPKLWKPIASSLLTKNSPLELEYEVVHRDDQYVEANPQVAIQEPTRTPYFASRSQLAAQADPLPLKKDNEPTLDGEEPLSQKIVQASLEEIPSTDIFEEQSAPKITEGLAAQKQPEPTEVNAPRPKPRPRPRVEQSTIPGPLRKTYGGTSRLGQTAISTRFTEYGAYLDRLFESIYYQWNLLLANYKFLAEDYNTLVEVRFTLNKEGHVNNITVAQTTASELATLICKDSICSLAPFENWTDEMIKSLGEKQELGIVFHFR